MSTATRSATRHARTRSRATSRRWGNIDWKERTLRICAARVRTITKVTKTSKVRIVELDEECMLLQQLNPHTFMAGQHLFTYPATGRAHPDTSNLVEKYWRPALKRCGIRDRDARQTRHTCATVMLMAGCNPAWAAGQLGHSVEMFLRTYSKWLPKNDAGRERAKLSKTLANSKKSACS